MFPFLLGLGTGAICVLVACCFVLYGLRKTGGSELDDA
jgi:hypothetical protein